MFNISINDLNKTIIGPACMEFKLEVIGSPQMRSRLAQLGYTNEFKVQLKFNEILQLGEDPRHFLIPGSTGTVSELIEAVEKVLKNKLLSEGRFKTVSGPKSDFEGDELLVRKETFGDNLPYTFRAPDLNRVSEVTSNNLRAPLNLQRFYSHLMQWLSCHGLSVDDVSVSHGGSMLLLGLIETTDDIDLTVSSEIFNGFDNGNHEIRPLENNRYLIKVGKRVDIHTSELHPLQLQSCLVKHPNGIWYRNAQQTLIDYSTLGRDKDQEKIQSLLKLCAHSSKDLTYRYGEVVGRGENIAGIPPTIEDPEALVELGTVPVNHKLLLRNIVDDSSLPRDAEGNVADFTPDHSPSLGGPYRQSTYGELPYQTVEIEGNKITSVDGKSDFNLEDGVYKLVLIMKGSIQKIKESLGSKAGILRSSSREIKVDLGVVVSDTQETESMVGIKMNLDSGIYQLQHGDWVLVNN